MARMGQKCGNPNWGRRPASVRSGLTEFEQLVAELGLKDEKAQLNSRRLREWVTKHRNNRYVPEELLSAYGLTVHVEHWSC
jgi:hypothetical protein